MKAAALLPLVLLFGCAGLSSYQVSSTDDAIRIVKQTGGTGCFYYRASGNARPYADVEGTSTVITTLGKGTSYLDCLQAIPEKNRLLAQ